MSAAPHKTITSISRGVLIDRMNRCFGRVRYQLGAKANLRAKPESIEEIDCSGFVRWLIYQATGGKIVMPDGSYHQRRWCTNQRFKPTDYSNCQLGDNRLRIAFMTSEGGHAGHVWLVINGQTIESYGGHGPGRRRWNAHPLVDEVDACFVLTEPLVG